MRDVVIPAFAGLSLLIAAAVIAPRPAAADAAARPESQDWIPAAVTLPSDMTVKVDRAIGSSTRIFSFETRVDGATLIADWAAALGAAGYLIKDPNPELAARQIDFSGPGIGNAKISIQPGAVHGTTTVQFDASLDN